MIEYLVGAQRPIQKLTPNSVAKYSILFTGVYSKIIFHVFHEENQNNLCAIEIDNNIILGTKYEKSIPLSIDFIQDKNYFDSMELQRVIKQAGDDKSLYWSNITYLKLVYQGKEYLIGEKKKVGMEKLKDNQKVLLEYDFLPVEIVHNPFYISGLTIHNAGIYCFQIIEFNENEHLNFSLIRKQFEYNTSKVGIIEGKSEDSDFNLENMIMDHNIISFENLESIKVLQLLYERIRGWTYTKSVLSTYYSKFLSIIDEALIEREYEVIYSVLRLERYLKSIIQRDLKLNSHKKYQDDLFLTVKLYRIWEPLSSTMKIIKHLHDSDLNLNCYQISFLSKNKYHLLYAYVTIVSQIGLILLLGLSLLNLKISAIFPLMEGIIIIPIIFIFTLFVVSKQIMNTYKFIKIFPNSIYTFVGLFDIFSNILCSITIIILNFFVLAFSNSLIDIVLNSLAALFIIELDDSMVFISDDVKQDLCKQTVIEMFNEKIKNIPNLYFDSKIWKYKGIYKIDNNKYYVDKNLCSILNKEESKHNTDIIDTNNVKIDIV
jgi:hypothetical protein